MVHRSSVGPMSMQNENEGRSSFPTKEGPHLYPLLGAQKRKDIGIINNACREDRG